MAQTRPTTWENLISLSWNASDDSDNSRPLQQIRNERICYTIEEEEEEETGGSSQAEESTQCEDFEEEEDEGGGRGTLSMLHAHSQPCWLV